MSRLRNAPITPPMDCCPPYQKVENETLLVGSLKKRGLVVGSQFSNSEWRTLDTYALNQPRKLIFVNQPNNNKTNKSFQETHPVENQYIILGKPTKPAPKTTDRHVPLVIRIVSSKHSTG
jgi:hypothetical protein